MLRVQSFSLGFCSSASEGAHAGIGDGMGDDGGLLLVLELTMLLMVMVATVVCVMF